MSEETINSVEDLEEETPQDETQPQEGTEESVNQETEVSGDESTEEETTESSNEEPSQDEEYSEEELQEILSVGKQVKDYQKSHPGFDPLLIHKDYTQKSMELADLKRSQPSQPETKEDKIDLSDVNQKDIEIIEKVLKGKGYVHKSEVEQMRQDDKRQSYEQTKQNEVNTFIKENPQYHPSNDPGDKKWNSLLAEFGLFKLPEDPRKIGALLKRADKSISGSGDFDVKKASKLLAQKKVNKVGAATGSGKSGGGGATVTKGKVSDFAKANLKGFSEAELEEYFN